MIRCIYTNFMLLDVINFSFNRTAQSYISFMIIFIFIFPSNFIRTTSYIATKIS
nr:MAG TPA_asm: hypothetical protein [Caudoviricetes sp.]